MYLLSYYLIFTPPCRLSYLQSHPQRYYPHTCCLCGVPLFPSQDWWAGPGLAALITGEIVNAANADYLGAMGKFWAHRLRGILLPCLGGHCDDRERYRWPASTSRVKDILDRPCAVVGLSQGSRGGNLPRLMGRFWPRGLTPSPTEVGRHLQLAKRMKLLVL